VRTHPDDHHHDATPYVFAATTGDADSANPDHIDAAAVASARAQPSVLGLWRAWRLPTNGSPWPPPRRIYLVEVELSTDLEAVATRIRLDLASAGERDGQVEVHPIGTAMPVYYRLARASAIPLFSCAPSPSNHHRADPMTEPTR
jgi:hypothetical protein